MRLSESEFNTLMLKSHAKIRNNNTGKATNLEQNISNETKGQNEIEAFKSPVSILIHSYRYRLADPDGISAKWAIDAIVKAGILVDDKSENIKEVRFKQTKIKKKDAEEYTVITIENV